MKRYETLTPDDIIRIYYEWEGIMYEGPAWCRKSTYNEVLDIYTCDHEEDLRCEDCLRRWLEEEVKPDPVWYSKEFIMEQVAALIEHDRSDLDLYFILDQVLADTPEQIRYKSVESYLEALEEAGHERIL